MISTEDEAHLVQSILKFSDILTVFFVRGGHFSYSMLMTWDNTESIMNEERLLSDWLLYVLWQFV